MLKWIGGKLKALHSDEQGADMVEYVLIVAAVALPLLVVAELLRALLCHDRHESH